MKKWMNYIAVIGLTAGTASAAWWPFGPGENEEQIPPPSAPEMQRMHRSEGMDDRQRPQMSSEQREKMRAMHEELMKIGEAARNETDPAKKEELVGQLRVKLTEIADKIQAEGVQRVEQAEKKLTKLKERLAEAEKNKASRIEEQIQRILAGEPLRGPGGAPWKKEGKRGPPPPDLLGEGMPPPPAE